MKCCSCGASTGILSDGQTVERGREEEGGGAGEIFIIVAERCCGREESHGVTDTAAEEAMFTYVVAVGWMTTVLGRR